MKIFSNFDTSFKRQTLEQKLAEFSSEEILLITRSKYYLLFQVIIPSLLLIILYISLYYALGFSDWIIYLRVPLIIMGGVFAWFQIVHKTLKYLYDFTIVDPIGITTFKQKGILRSYLKQIPAKRIRSIQVTRNRLLQNIFGYGNIDIHTDFVQDSHVGEDDESPSLIGLTYVDTPYSTKNKLTTICFK